ncbi:ABC transporter ATP-binding protein [Microbispora sp. CA-102843]|uniref:ABC transporter ATP-binding protein n=1 Tax=Microbispora sp. CA-102843 TaxID=3239952 RepID=UPI003D94B22A
MDHTASEPDIVLRIRSLRKAFGDHEVLRSVDLDLSAGEFLTLLGPSGSGKTTLLRIIAGFDTHDSGQILLNGRDIAGLSPAERDLGMVFQNYALFPHMTVAENVAYGLKMRRWDAAKRARRVTEMLELVGLPDKAGSKPQQLSGGQQQRVALARALAYEPQLLLMDEPLGALDRSLRLQLQQEIRRVHREVGTTIVFVTHDQEEALALSDRVAIMQDGRLAGLAAPSELYQNPPSRFVARFFSNANIIPAVVSDGGSPGLAKVIAAGSAFTLPNAHRGEAALAVRPRCLRPAVPGDALQLTGTVVESLLLGEERLVRLDVEGVGPVTASIDWRGTEDITPGQPCRLSAPAGDIVVLAE